ncbi:hypothetical protein OG241_02850 [Streptomyces sp. NBC_01390]
MTQCSEARVVMERLTRARLLTADEDGVQLAHEALITSWPRLQGWIEEDRERLRHHRTLTETARAWQEHGSCPGMLYRGAQLARAAEYFPDPAAHPALTAPERAFLTASHEAREAERRATDRIDRRHRVLTRSLSAVLAVALLTAFAVWRAHDDALRRRTQDAARRVASAADGLRTTDPRTALLLSAASWRIARLPETHRALLGSLSQPRTDTFTDPAAGDTPQRQLTDNGRTLFSASGGIWRSWDVPTHRRTGEGRLPMGKVTAVGPHARVIAISRTGGTRLWDTALGRWTAGSHPLPGLGDVHLTDDGRAYLATDGKSLRLGSVTDGRVLFKAPAPESTVSAVSADGQYAAVCPAGRAPSLWDTAAGRPLSGAWKQDRLCAGGSTELTVGAGRMAAVTGAGVRVWDLRSGRRIADLVTSAAHDLAFTADGTFLTLATRQDVQVWRLTDTDGPVFQASLDNQELGSSPALHLQGHTLRYLAGGTVHTLDLGAAVTAAWRPTAQADVVLSPDGRTFATAEFTHDHYLVRLCGTADGRVVHTFPPLSATMPSIDPLDIDVLLVFSTDGTRLGYGVTAAGHTLRTHSLTVWDVPHERVVTTLDLPGASVAEAALGPQGRTLHLTRLGDDDLMFGEVWDTRSRRRIKVPAGPAVQYPTLRGDGRLLAGDGVVARPPSWRASALDLVGGSPLGALAFSPDGSRLAVGDMTGRVTLWDGDLRHRVTALPNTFRPSQGPPLEAVSALAVSPDGRTLAVGGGNGGLQLWDMPTGQPIGGLLTTAGDAIYTLAFGPDGTTLYTGSAHVPLQRYDLDPAHALARVCARTGGPGLTRTQWQTYVPDAPYRQVCPSA